MFQKKSPVEKRSPLKIPPLRHPGQSLDEEVDRIFDEKVMSNVVMIVFLAVFILLEWIRSLLNTPPKPLGVTVICVIISLYFLFRILKMRKEVSNLRLGSDGEKIVGQALEGLREKGYKVYHDILGEGFNIDHVIVGPAGVFTIETKTIRKKGDSKISYDGIHIKIDGFTPDRDPVKQAKIQKYWMESFISEYAKVKIKVRPVVIFPGWFVNPWLSDAEVWVLNEKALPSYLDNAGTNFTAEQINLISSNLENYIRNY